APAALTLERLHRAGFVEQLPLYHPDTVTVPGACAAWCDLVARFGKLPLSDVLAPAIRLAEEGFPVSPVTAHFWQNHAENRLSRTPGGLELTLEGRAPQPGEIFRNPGLGRALRSVAQGGAPAFYQGEIAAAIASAVRAAGGCLSEADLAAHRSTWEQPVHTPYHSLRIWECPPNGQGIAVLLALNILEGFDLSGMEPLSAARLHLEIEAMRLAFADTRWYAADPAFNPAPLEALLSKEYAAEQRKRIDPRQANPDLRRGRPLPGSNTVYLSVVDGAGNACSFINSIYSEFGSGIVPPGWGFSLHNRGHSFSLDPAHPNALAPGKRPYHTIIPSLATVAQPGGPGSQAVFEPLYACFGVMGAFMQPQGQLQVVTAMQDDGADPQAALDLPRFCILDGVPNGAVALEQGISPKVMAELAEMGHSVLPTQGYDRAIFGRGQIIRRGLVDGVLCGGSDPRADGCAMTI
ncbi:MAG TPA: gamma-glutamyltransferase, partial [Anaerolineales bacterium]